MEKVAPSKDDDPITVFGEIMCDDDLVVVLDPIIDQVPQACMPAAGRAAICDAGLINTRPETEVDLCLLAIVQSSVTPALDGLELPDLPQNLLAPTNSSDGAFFSVLRGVLKPPPKK